VDKFELPEIKTKYMQAILDNLEVSNALVVDKSPSEVLVRSARNIPFVKVVDVAKLNVYDILLHENLILTSAAKQALEGVLKA
jgi:large subunit ribosomal protein L4